jgi:hypothetical protein
VNSNLSNSEVSAASLPGRSYRISPIALPSGHALLHGRRSTIPHGFGTVCARACSIAKALTSYSTETTYFGHSAAAKSSEPSEPTARIGRTWIGRQVVPTAHPQIWAARSELIAGHWTPRFMVTTSVGTPFETAHNRRANGRARLASQAQLSGPQESVTALGNLRMGTPGLQAEAARDLARRLVRQGGID